MIDNVKLAVETVMKKVALIACLMVLILPDARVWADPLEADTDPDSSGGLFAWVKVGSAPTGYLDYDGKVFDSDTVMYGDQTVFYGLADADVARVGGGSVKAVAIKWYHDSYWSGEDMHLPDNGSSLGMASATYKPFLVTSDDVADGETVSCTINVVYDGLIVLQEKKEGDYSSGQIDFGIELLDAPDEDSFVTTSTGEEFCFEGQLRIEDKLVSGTHTYTAVDAMAPATIVNLDAEELGEDPEANYWAGAGQQDVTIAVIDASDPSQFEVLQGSLDAVPQKIQDAIVAENYNATGNKIYYVVFDKTTTFDATVGQSYWIGMDAHAAAQTSLGTLNVMAGNETFVACDFSNTAKYSMMMADATARTLIGIDDPNAFGDGGSGTADVAGAVLRWSDDVDLGNAIQLVDGAEATIDTQQYDASVGAIGGTGDLLKTGAGTLTLAENSTFTGDTILAEGGLVINAQYASDITVEGGTLGGSGTLADVAVTGGRIAPGNSIGTMTLDGAFTLNGGTLEVEIDDSGAADKIIADSAELTSGTVCVVPLEPITDKRDYTIIETTDGVTGDPDDLGKEISDRSYLLDFSLGVVDNDLILTATQVESFANLSASSTNPNAGHVASVLDGAVTNGLGGSQMAALQMMNAPQLTQTVEQLSPQVHQGSSQAIGRQAGAIRQSTLGRINTVQYASRQSEKGLWDYALATAGTDAMGPASQGAWPFPEMMEDDWVGFARSLNDWGEVDGDQYANGYRWRTHGMDLGAETLVDSDKLVGFSITPLWTGVTGADSSGTADVVSLFGNLYGSWFHDTWHIDAGTFYGHAWTDTHRPISALGLQAEGDYESDIFSLFLGGGLVWNRKEYEIEPFVVWDYTSRADGGYSESGAGSLNLDIQRNHTDSLRHLLGIRVSKMSKATKGARIRSYASAAWEHEYLQDQIIGDVDLLGQTFSSFGHKIDRDSGLFSAGVDWRARDNVSVFADYTATINRDLTSHNVNAGLRILF